MIGQDEISRHRGAEYMCEYKPSVRFILKKVAWTSFWCTKPDDKGCSLHEICIWKLKLEFISTVCADLLQVFCNFARAKDDQKQG